MRSIVGNDARSQMRLRQRQAKLIVPAGAPTLDKMIPFVDSSKAPPLPTRVSGASRRLNSRQNDERGKTGDGGRRVAHSFSNLTGLCRDPGEQFGHVGTAPGQR